MPSKVKALPDVLTLAEAATYLRTTKAEVQKLVERNAIPGKKVGGDWRFLKSALEDWLKTPALSSKQYLLSLAGTWKDDPTVPEMLEEIYRERARNPVGLAR